MTDATIRAAVVRKGHFAIETLPEPVPGAGQVLVRTRKCGICGSDLHLFKHAEEMMQAQRDLGLSPGDLSDGLILGHEFVAEIESFGPGCAETLNIGDRVCSIPFLMTDGAIDSIGASVDTVGAYAEKLLLTEAVLVKVPDSVTDQAAALAEPVAIGVHAVNKAAMSDTDIPVVIGCGPIGLAVISVLKMRGYETIIAADLSPKRRELAAAMGATKAIDPREANPYDGIDPTAQTIVFECTGANGVLGGIVKQAPLKSKVIIAGIVSGEDSYNALVAVTKELTFIFVTYYDPAEFVDALQAIADGHINWQAWVTGEVGLAGVEGAFEALENPEAHAKILIDPSSDATL